MHRKIAATVLKKLFINDNGKLCRASLFIFFIGPYCLICLIMLTFLLFEKKSKELLNT